MRIIVDTSVSMGDVYVVRCELFPTGDTTISHTRSTSFSAEKLSALDSKTQAILIREAVHSTIDQLLPYENPDYIDAVRLDT